MKTNIHIKNTKASFIPLLFMMAKKLMAQNNNKRKIAIFTDLVKLDLYFIFTNVYQCESFKTDFEDGMSTS